jgi:hypothetical protein
MTASSHQWIRNLPLGQRRSKIVKILGFAGGKLIVKSENSQAAASLP